MSEDYVEYTVRITLKELKDKSTKEQLEWFEERFGECGWVNIAEGDIESFDYHDFIAKPENIYINKNNKGDYEIDIYIKDRNKEANLITLNRRKIINSIVKKYKININNYNFSKIELVSYTWFEGCKPTVLYELK